MEKERQDSAELQLAAVSESRRFEWKYHSSSDVTVVTSSAIDKMLNNFGPIFEQNANVNFEPIFEQNVGNFNN